MDPNNTSRIKSLHKQARNNSSSGQKHRQVSPNAQHAYYQINPAQAPQMYMGVSPQNQNQVKNQKGNRAVAQNSVANQQFRQEEEPTNQKGQYDSQESHFDQYDENSQPHGLQPPVSQTQNQPAIEGRIKTIGKDLTNLIAEVNDGQEIETIIANLKEFHDKVTNPGSDLQDMITQCLEYVKLAIEKQQEETTKAAYKQSQVQNLNQQ